jgi:hypothetical protein
MKKTVITASSLLLLAACGGEGADASRELAYGSGDVQKVDPGKADTSAEAVVVDMAFSGTVQTDSAWNTSSVIEDQLLYTIGHLNGTGAVGRLDKVQLSNVKSTDAGGHTRITYDASLQVAWRKSQGVPAKYAFTLPLDMSYAGQKAFTDKYGHTCVDSGAHDVTPDSMWYYYRPSKCHLADADVVHADATVTVSDVNTTGKYPEYHKVWEDGAFNIVAVFGKYEDGATTESDAGIQGYDTFAARVRDLLAPHGLVTEPASVPSAPGAATPDVTFSAKLDDGHQVVVHALLVDNVRSAGRAFDERYRALSGSADLIIYNGHAGLGANIRALAQKGQWQPGQYVMVFMNGCDTYAYVDSALFQAHARVNPDDPDGTKYVDLLANAHPAFFASMAGASLALVKGLMAYDQPRTYEQMFKDVDDDQIVLVTGEEDNEYVPGFGTDTDTPPADAWTGLARSGALDRGQEVRETTPTLPAGKYRFTIEGTGDADLYVRVGLEPSQSEYDCRPYKSGSSEACELSLTTPAAVHVMVRGYAAHSTFDLAGSVE